MHEKLTSYLEGNMSETEFVSQWLLDHANLDCTDTAEMTHFKESITLRSLVQLLLLEIKYPIASKLIEIKELKEDDVFMNETTCRNGKLMKDCECC